MPVCVSIVELMELSDPPSEGRDGGLPHWACLAPHTHGQLYLERVNIVYLGVFLDYEPSVIVAELARTGTAG